MSTLTDKQIRWRNRIIAALALFAIAFAIEQDGLLIAWFGEPGDLYAELVLFLVPYLIAGYDVLLKAARNIGRGQVFDENFLMSVATIGAFALVLFPDTEPHMAEGAAVMLFYQVGELFQSYAVGKSRKSIADMMDIAPEFANIMRDGQLVQVDPYEVSPGDEIVVKPGERIPLDGVVVSGQSQVDTAALTGESVPRQADPGDEVISGCVNLTGALTVRVTKPFEDSTVSRILELVENAADKKARTESFITRFARYYTPAVVGVAAALAILPPLLFGQEWADWILRGLTFLVVSCPCALVISVPLSFFGGIGGASRVGILVKGSNYLEALAHAETVVFDKTGTLTNGTFAVTAIHAEGDTTEEELLALAAHAESLSNHPIAASVHQAYAGPLDPARIQKAEEVSGQGVRAVIDEREVLVGNGRLMDSAGANWHDCELVGTILHVAIDGVYAGHIIIADMVKDDAATAIAALRKAGVRKTVMLTGDRADVAQAVAAQLGIDEVRAELLPQDKVAQVEALLDAQAAANPKGKLAFVGDGINDAPVLTRADLGIAMGAMGSDAAIEAADVVLMDDRPSQIARAISIARKTMAIVWENIVFALGVKLAVLALAAVGIANMWMAVFADVGVAVIAILNAMRAMKVRK
ncbi:MAG: cadmium-translocating P-type ATPase [Eggerthellaceae bacterium]|nr:cadmium-translocating P-type ATPase [Eggerthellaceae bacterium]